MLATVQQATSIPPIQIGESADTLNTNENWKNIINLRPEFNTYCTKYINILEQFQAAWDGHLQQINTGPHRVELSSPEGRPIHVVPYHADQEAREAEKEEIDRMLAIQVDEPAQTV